MVMAFMGVGLFFIGIVVMICYPINKKKNARCSAQTQGTLENIIERYNSEGSLKDMHVYSYQVDGVDYELRTVDHNLDVKEVGDTCTIWYNPKKPKDAQAFRGSDKYLKYLLLLGVGITLLGIILTFVGLATAFK